MSVHTPLSEDDYSFIWNAMERVGRQADALKFALTKAASIKQVALLTEALTALNSIVSEAADVQSALYDAWEAGGGLNSSNEQMEARS